MKTGGWSLTGFDGDKRRRVTDSTSHENITDFSHDKRPEISQSRASACQARAPVPHARLSRAEIKWNSLHGQVMHYPIRFARRK